MVDDVEVAIVSERVQYLDANGKLITESLKDYTRKAVRKAYTSLSAFLNAWNDADRKQAIIDELASQGVFLDELADQVGRDIDAFDLVCHVAFDQPPQGPVKNAPTTSASAIFSASMVIRPGPCLKPCSTSTPMQDFKSVETLEILKVDPLTQFGTPVEIVNLFGGKQNYLAAVQELEFSSTRKPPDPCRTSPDIVKTIQDIMRKDAGTYGDAQRLEQLGWMFFLKIFDDREKELELIRDSYKSPLPNPPALVRLGHRCGRDHRRCPARLRQQHVVAKAQGLDRRRGQDCAA